MPPFPAVTSGNATEVSSVVGGSDAALSWPSILAFGAILLAAMQGTLVLESADPCRISFLKVCILLVLEVLEVAVALASEISSFAQLRGALTSRLQWLQWVAPCLLCIGFLEILLDLYFTLYMASISRVYWVPFSDTGKKQGDKKVSMIFEILPLLVTACSSMCLIGWRQRWWWAAPAVTANEAILAAKQESAISIGAIVFSVVWAFILTVGMILLCAVGESAIAQEQSLFLFLRFIFRPNGFPEDSVVMFRSNDDAGTRKAIEEKSFKLLYALRHVEQDDEVQDPDSVKITQSLMQAPLHIGNAIVGIDQTHPELYGTGSNVLHTMLLLVENFTILPLQICFVTAVARLSDKLDAATFSAFKEIVDAVIVLALVEIAVGLKNILWGVGGGPLHKFDIPLRDTTVTGGEK